MHHHFIDQHSGGEGFYKRLDPAVKTLATLSFIISVATTPNNMFTLMALFASVLLFLAVSARVPLLFIGKRLLIVLPFVVFVGLFVPFTTHEFSAGLLAFASLLCKAMLCATATLLLVTTTHFEALLKGFERLKMPKLVVMTISFMYRYIFILSDQIMSARQAKEARAPGMGNLASAKVLANILGTVFLKTYERGEEVYLAMCARGFTGSIRTLDAPAIRAKDIIVGTVLAIIPIAIRIAGAANGK